MFERLTAPASFVMIHAHEAARRLGATEIQPEHLLLALLETDDGAAHDALVAAGVNPRSIADSLGLDPRAITPRGVPFSEGAKRVLDLSAHAADERHSALLGTADLLLGLLASQETAAWRALDSLAGADALRQGVLDRLEQPGATAEKAVPRARPVKARAGDHVLTTSDITSEQGFPVPAGSRGIILDRLRGVGEVYEIEFYVVHSGAEEWNEEPEIAWVRPEAFETVE